MYIWTSFPISQRAAKPYWLFAGFSETFSETGRVKGVMRKSDGPLGWKEDSVLNEKVNQKVIIDFIPDRRAVKMQAL